MKRVASRRRLSVSSVASWSFTNGIPLLLLVVWYFAALKTPEYILPGPVAVFSRTFDLIIGDPNLFIHTYVSLARIVGSVILALVIGGILVLLAHYFSVTRGLVIDRILPTFNAFPALGWAILGLFWFGVGDLSVMFVEVAILLPFTMISLWQGLRSLDFDIMEMASSFTDKRLKVLRKVVMPQLVPYIFSALRISYGIGWKVSLIAELFGSSVGLGYLLNYSRQQFDTTALFATVLTLIGLVYAVDKLVFDPLEKRLSKFKAA